MVDNVLAPQTAAPRVPTRDVVATSPRPEGFPVVRLLGKLLTYGILVGLGILAFMPFFWMISNSLMTLGETQVRRLLPATPPMGELRSGVERR